MPLYNPALGMIPPPAVGVHDNVAESVYRSWDAASQSLLRTLWTGQPLHCKAALNGIASEQSAAQRFGGAMHMRLLEPDRYATEYAVAQRCGALLSGGANAGRQCRNMGKFQVQNNGVVEWRCGTHSEPGAIEPERMVTAEEAADIETLRQALMGHEVVRLLRQHGGHEVSLVWRHNGYDCKGRLDKLIPHGTAPLTIIDIKKVQRYGAQERKFTKSVVDYAYALQAAYYVEAVEQLMGEVPRFIWVAIEDKPPHDVGIYILEEDSLECGRLMLEQCRNQFYRCLETDLWPGSSWDSDNRCENIKRIGLPGWLKKQLL